MRARAYRICQESTDLGFEKSIRSCVFLMSSGSKLNKCSDLCTGQSL